MNAETFQKHAEKMFPLVPHMGLGVKVLNKNRCVLTGTAALNKNHLGTVFGGSLYSFTALSCYGWIWAKMASCGIDTNNLVISQGSIKYFAPVTGDFEAICESPAEESTSNFVSTYQKKNKSRIQLVAKVICQGKVCAEFTGDYVAMA